MAIAQKENGVTERDFEIEALKKLTSRLFLTGCSVAMVTYYIERMTITSLQMIWEFAVYNDHLTKSGSTDPSKYK